MKESVGVGLYLMTLGRMTAWSGLAWPGLSWHLPLSVSLTDDGRYMIYGHGQGIFVSCILFLFIPSFFLGN